MDNDTTPLQIRVFLPSLVERLLHAEAASGVELTESEVLAIVASADSTEMIEPHARMLEERRGYRDLDPDHAWADWLAFREEVQASGEVEGGGIADDR